jgi:hypothetical protein
MEKIEPLYHIIIQSSDSGTVKLELINRFKKDKKFLYCLFKENLGDKWRRINVKDKLGEREVLLTSADYPDGSSIRTSDGSLFIHGDDTSRPAHYVSSYSLNSTRGAILFTDKSMTWNSMKHIFRDDTHDFNLLSLNNAMPNKDTLKRAKYFYRNGEFIDLPKPPFRTEERIDNLNVAVMAYKFKIERIVSEDKKTFELKVW